MTEALQVKKRGPVFWIFLTFGSLALVSLLAWTLLQIDAMRRFAVNAALESINSNDLQIDYGSLEGNWPWRIGITDVTAADDAGVWLTIDEVSLTWSPLAILANRAQASQLTINGVYLNRVPESAPDPEPDRDILPPVPNLPIDLHIQEFSITNFQLDKDVMGTALKADMRGDILWTAQTIDGRLTLTQASAEGLETTIAFALDPTVPSLDLSITGQEGRNGFLRRLAELDTNEPVAFSFEGSGPDENWQGRLKTDGASLGRAEANITITNTAPLAPSVVAEVTLGSALPEAWRNAVGERVEAVLSARNMTQDRVTLDNATILTGSGIKLTAKGKLEAAAQATDAEVSAVVNDATVLSAFAGIPLQGSMKLDATLTGSLRDLSIKATIDGKDIVVDKTAFGQLSGIANWPGIGDQDGHVDLSINSPLGPGTVKGKIVRNATGDITLSDINADWLSTKVEGNITTYKDSRLSGEIDFETASLQQISFLSQFAGIDAVSGAARGKVSLPHPAHSKVGEIDLTLINFRLGNGTETFAAKSLTARGRIEPQASGKVVVSANANDVVFPGLFSSISVGSIVLNADGTNENAAWSLAASEINQSQDNIEASGSYANPATGERTVTVGRLVGSLAEKPTSIDGAIIAKQDEAGWTLSPFTLKHGSGSIKGAGTFLDAGLTAELNIAQFPLDFGGGEFEPINGTLSGSVSLDTLSEAMSGSGTFELISKSQSGQLGTTNVSADWDGERLLLSGDLEGAGTFDGSLPLISANGAFHIPGNGTIGFSSTVKGAVGPLWRLGPYSEYEIKGQGTLDVSASGTWSDPQITGTASLREGYFESFGDGIFLKNLEVDLRAENSERATMVLSATDGKKGRVKGSGDIRFVADEHLPLTITADFDKAEILRSESVDAQVSGRTTLAGNTEDLTLSGNILINRMDIRIPNELPPSVVDLPVEIVNVPPALQDVLENGPREAENPITLDIDVRAPNRVFVEGRGLNSEWKAKVKVGGDTNTPRVEGKAEIVKGAFQFAGRPFDLERGLITFDGGKETDPRLDVLASREDDDITVAVRVRGLASDPQISLQSSPSLPQEDVLARILFGKPVEELSYVELAQLGESIASLSGKSLGGGGRGLFGNVRQSLGVDVLSVDTGSIASAATDDEEAVGPSLTVGKYVTNRVYVGVTQGTDEDSTAVEVEVDITRRLSLSTEVGQKANSNIGLNWSWDY